MAKCKNCSFWNFLHPEADGKQTGICRRHSRKEWKYDEVSIREGERELDVFDFLTKDKFSCSSFIKNL